MTIQEFVKKHNIKLKVNKVEQNPYMISDGKSWDADHYEVTLQVVSNLPSKPVETKKLTTYYSKGVGHKGKLPTTEEVLDSLILDADALEFSFQEWAWNCGYSTDSINALKTYELCTKIGNDLVKFLGRDGFSELRACERL